MPPDQYVAVAHRLGPQTLTAVHIWRYGVGIPVRKVPTVLAALTVVRLTQNALTPDIVRHTAGRVGTVYEQLRAAVPQAPVVHTDETGWRVDGIPALLMAFETEARTISQIRPRHHHEAVQAVLPAKDEGVMVTDRGHRDDAQAFDRVDQQKCLAHVLRSIREVVETKSGRACDFGEQLKALLQEALALRHAPRVRQVKDFRMTAEAVRAEITYQLWDRCLRDPNNQRLLDELGWPHGRGNLLRFLVDPPIEPTNNRAERALCPAVIARKVSHCSKNERGAHAFAAFTSVVRTLAKSRAEVLVEGLYHLFRTPGL